MIIPTYNGADTLRELFAVLYYQSVKPFEILVTDSSSTDESVEICREYGARVTVIPQGEFDHGGTRTELAREATGDILVFFTQDAIPTTRDCIEQLIEPFADPEVACSYGRQLPLKSATFAAAHLRRFNYPSDSVVKSYEDRKRLGIETMFCSNSCAAYRKAYLAEVGYFKNGLIFGEDTCSVGRLLQSGYKVAYVAEAAVYHSHNYDLIQEFNRSFDIGVLHITEQELFKDFGKAEKRGFTYIRSAFKALKAEKKYSEMVDFCIRAVMKYTGYGLGKNYRKLPARLRPVFSMHSSWWENQQ